MNYILEMQHHEKDKYSNTIYMLNMSQLIKAVNCFTNETNSTKHISKQSFFFLFFFFFFFSLNFSPKTMEVYDSQENYGDDCEMKIHQA